MKVEQLSKKSSKVNNKEKNELKKKKTEPQRPATWYQTIQHTCKWNTRKRKEREWGRENTEGKKKFPKFDIRQKFASTKCQMNTK